MIGFVEPVSVHLRLNGARLWRWQRELVARLTAHPDVDLSVSFADGPPPPHAFALLTALERFAFRLHGPHACDRLDRAAFAGSWTGNGRTPQLTLDLSGSPLGDDAPGAVRLLYDGVADDDALLVALLDGRSCEIAAVDGRTGRSLGSARPAIEDPAVITRALDCAFTALLRLCVRVLTGPDAGEQAVIAAAPASPTAGIGTVTMFGLRTLAGKLDLRLKRLCGQAPRWFVAWRHLDAETGGVTLPGVEAYQRLPDDGLRYYADPFLFSSSEGTFLFVEEYVEAMQKGIISAASFDPATGFTTPRPVLETAVHLSYPLVFAHGGEVWMIPETLQAQSIELYRAERLPDVWVHEATLLNGVDGSDATILHDGGLWWMFVATRDWRGSNWDTLSVFHAEQLLGPWQPHVANPVVIDSRSARPAGHVFRHGGALWRPAQDCSDGYGAGLAICRIEQLDRDAVRQTVHSITRLRTEGVSRGPHTLNRLGGVEMIDLFGVRP
ncbi:MAG: hypothetical protein AB1586_23300 [Pseudomonadota bacterium]